MTQKRITTGANPYMPLWEHVPDGEPRVFTYNGEKRVYLYGSHDTFTTQYCGDDYVCWSAPADDLTNWTCHGVCYKAADGDALFAPDVVEKDGTYYMYAAEAHGSRIVVASSQNPAGPFENPVLTELGFDPGVLVDDDGRVYAYWGFSGSCCAELEDDMATIRKGTLHVNPIGHARTPWAKPEGEDIRDGFFEASSPRKVLGKYVYIYSKMYNEPKPEYGVYGDNNGFLSYKYSDSPLEGFVDGGDISFNGGEIILRPDSTGQMTYQWGNNHGSIAEVNGQWYVFYHRQTGTDEYSRQAMAEPVDVAIDDDGRLFIGQITYDGEKKDGTPRPVSSKAVPMTSQGFMTSGIDATSTISASYACHIYTPDAGDDKSLKAYVKPVRDKESTEYPVVNIRNGCTVGFRYLNFGDDAGKRLRTAYVTLSAQADMTVIVRSDSYNGEELGRVHVQKGDSSATIELAKPLTGKRAIYFEFQSTSSEPFAEFTDFRFAE